MSRIGERFKLLQASGRKALIPYITAGDPQSWLTVPLMHALVQAGADILEFGVPFSDPMAEGPVIQRACERALKNHISLSGVLAMVGEFRSKDDMTPVVLMGYLNPLEAMGYARFAREAADAGVDGVLIVDLPPEEGNELRQALRAHRLDTILLLAPTSSPERIKLITDAASGFIYYVSLRGVTGAGHLDLQEVRHKLDAIRGYTHQPLGVGFGIHSPETAAAVATVADAVIVGSALVKRIEEFGMQPEKILTEVPAFLASLRRAMDKVASESPSNISSGANV